MASALRPRLQESALIPEEASSFKNIEATFPKIYDDGKELLEQTAGKIQVMRLETEIFPSLTIEENKDLIRHKESEYKQISEDVAEYRRSLQTVNGQIQRAIDLCSQVPVADVREWQQEEAVKVYDLCQKYLPILKDWKIHGTLLDKRFELIMAYDPKHYADSMVKFSSTVNPSSSTLLSSVAGFFTGWGASSGPSSELEAEKRKREELEAKLAQINISEFEVEEQKKM